jgi:hypothetical protein
METISEQEFTPKFVCNICDFKSSNKKDYNKHILTKKHSKLINNIDDKTIISKPFCCNICNKLYNSRTGLWKHKKICKEQQIILNTQEEETDITATDAKLVFELLKQNNEFKELIMNQTNQMMTQIMELAKNNSTTNNIVNGNVNNNTQNTQFNIQMYLNETCKNAMTIDEFLDYLQPTLEELEDTARLGYVEGITRIIMRGLKDLEEELRPFHCSDLKRESLFVKNPDGEWEKETDEKPLMLKFVKAVARKNFNNVNEWRKLHPNCRYHDSKSNDMFNQIMLNSTSGRTEEEQMASYKKIIKNIVKESVIDKSKKNK